MTNKPDYYDILGISRNAGQNEIKKAYRRLAREHHPDVNSGNTESEARFKMINEAYQVLCDPEKRELYDRYGHAGLDQTFDPGGGGFGDFGGFGDIFDLFFGGTRRARTTTRTSAERGSDLRYDVELTLEEAARGGEQENTIYTQRTMRNVPGRRRESRQPLRDMSYLSGSGTGPPAAADHPRNADSYHHLSQLSR